MPDVVLRRCARAGPPREHRDLNGELEEGPVQLGVGPLGEGHTGQTVGVRHGNGPPSDVRLVIARLGRVGMQGVAPVALQIAPLRGGRRARSPALGGSDGAILAREYID